MAELKKEAAKAAAELILPGQTIGLGAGSTVAHLIDIIKQREDLAAAVTFLSSSFKTNKYLLENGLKIQSPLFIEHLDIYFDGCDQLDLQLNALKSGGGIHTLEKILAVMAAEFILMGDEDKLVDRLDAKYPVVIEVLPVALPMVLKHIEKQFPDTAAKLRMSTQKDGALISENGNLLADLHFDVLPEPGELNIALKMIPGVVEHSLFFNIASKAIIAGEKGIRLID